MLAYGYEVIQCYDNKGKRTAEAPSYFGIYNRKANKFVGIVDKYEDQEVIELSFHNNWFRKAVEMDEELVNILMGVIQEDTTDHDKKVNELNRLIRVNSNTNTLESIKLVQGYLGELEELLTNKKENVVNPIIKKEMIVNSIDSVVLFTDYVRKHFGYGTICDTTSFTKQLIVTINCTIKELELIAPKLESFRTYTIKPNRISPLGQDYLLKITTNNTNGSKVQKWNQEKMQATYNLLTNINSVLKG